MQQKLFRIERMVGDSHRPAPTQPHLVDAGDDELAALRQELALLREAFTDNTDALAALITDGKERRMTRAAGELGAAVGGMEKATDTILQSVEIIDDRAKALTLARISDYERGLAQDIQDHVVRVYEACNFQDLVGQRIGKVIAVLDLIDRRLNEVVEQYRNPGTARAPVEPAQARELVHGPHLDGDSGHVSQRDIDTLFG